MPPTFSHPLASSSAAVFSVATPTYPSWSYLRWIYHTNNTHTFGHVGDSSFVCGVPRSNLYCGTPGCCSTGCGAPIRGTPVCGGTGCGALSRGTPGCGGTSCGAPEFQSVAFHALATGLHSGVSMTGSRDFQERQQQHPLLYDDSPKGKPLQRLRHMHSRKAYTS